MAPFMALNVALHQAQKQSINNKHEWKQQRSEQ